MKLFQFRFWINILFFCYTRIIKLIIAKMGSIADGNTVFGFRRYFYTSPYSNSICSQYFCYTAYGNGTTFIGKCSTTNSDTIIIKCLCAITQSHRICVHDLTVITNGNGSSGCLFELLARTRLCPHILHCFCILTNDYCFITV